MSTLTFAQLVNSILGLANTLVPALIGLAMIAFFFGLIRYIYEGGESSSAHTYGRQLIGWGLLAMFVLVCIWGLVDFLRVAFLGS